MVRREAEWCVYTKSECSFVHSFVYSLVGWFSMRFFPCFVPNGQISIGMNHSLRYQYAADSLILRLFSFWFSFFIWNHFTVQWTDIACVFCYHPDTIWGFLCCRDTACGKRTFQVTAQVRLWFNFFSFNFHRMIFELLYTERCVDVRNWAKAAMKTRDTILTRNLFRRRHRRHCCRRWSSEINNNNDEVVKRME